MGDPMADARAVRAAQTMGESGDVWHVERMAAGDREAFLALYERYAARVMAMVRKQISQPELSEELTQQVFLAAWLTASGYRQDLGTPEAWLLGIARHKLLDHCRRSQRVVAIVAGECDLVPGASSPLDLDQQLSVEQALVRLTPEQ